ncbi:MAG: translocation/assembly module TamB domain-containing protein [Deltaproteobacteria bacterium]
MSEDNKNTKKKSLFRRVLYVALKSPLVFFLLFINIITLVLATPTIQNAISKEIAGYLSEKTGFDFQIEKINLDLNRGLQLNHVSVKDNRNDTLLSAGYLSTSLLRNIIPMVFSGNYNFSTLHIENAKINIFKKDGDSLSNLQLLISRLKLPESGKTECTVFTLKKLVLNNSRISIDNFDLPVTYSASIDQSEFRFKKFDLCGKMLIAEVINLNHPSFYIRSKGYGKAEKNNPETAAFTFPFDIKVERIKINGGRFRLASLNASDLVERPGLVDYKNMDIKSIDLEAKEVVLNREIDWKAKNFYLSFFEKSGFELNEFSFERGNFTRTKMDLGGLVIKTQNTDLTTDIKMVYTKPEDFNDFADNVFFNIKFSDSYLTLADLSYFIRNYEEKKGLEKLFRGRISLNGKVSGLLNDFKTDNIELNIQDKLLLSSDIQCKNLTDKDLLFFNVNNLLLNSSSSFIEELFPKVNLSDRFKKFGKIEFTGSFFGYFNEFNSRGLIKTDIGSADVDLFMSLKNGSKNIKYYGQLLLSDFKLGNFLDQANVGNIGGKIIVLDGTNLTPETIKTDFNAEIDSIEFNNYKYRNVRIDGLLEAKTFIGELAVNDINFDLKLDGKIDYQQNVPVFNFKAILQDADIKALKLFKKDLFVNSEVFIDIFGDKAEDFIGKIKVRNVEISNGKEIATLDSLSIYSAVNKRGERYLDGDSDIFSFYFDGKYKIEKLRNSVFSLFDRHFSKFLVGLKDFKKQEEDFKDFYYNYNFSIFDSENFLSVLTGKPFKAINFSVDGSAYHNSDSIKMQLRFDSLRYDKYVAAGFDSDFNLFQGFGDFKLTTDQLIYNNTVIGNLSFNSDVDKDELYFHTNIDSISSGKNSISFSGRTIPHRDSFEIQLFGGYITVMNDIFEFSGENRLMLGKNYINLYDFNLSDNESRVLLEDVNNNKGIRLNFNRFDANALNLLVKYDKLNFSGYANGFIELEDIFKPEIFESQIEIPELAVNGDLLGSFKSNILIDPAEKDKLLFNAVISGDKPFLLATGNYDFKQKTFFGDFTLDDYPLVFLEHIIGEGATETNGYIDGNLTVKGPFKQININGTGIVNGGSTKVIFLNSRYSFDKQKFNISNKGIDFKGVVFSDENGDQGHVISGGIIYNRFKDWGVDIQLASDKIISLNTSKKDNSDFWGYAVGKTKASFKGLFKETIKMDINITTASESNLTIPVKLYLGTEGGSFINYSKKETDNTQSIPIEEESKIEMELYVNITEESAVTIIMDEKTGDYLKGNGNGIIRMVMNKDKDFDVFGDYRFVKGNYVFKYELLEFGLINKEFIIRPGSHILFSGNIYDANIDIKADYRANRISLYNLLDEYNRIENASYTADVDLILLLGGTLSNPEINFDFNFDNIDERIRSQMISKIQKLKADPNAMYTQAVSLLTFVNFVPDQSLNETFQNETFISSGLAGGVNTISELIANQLSQYVTGLLREMVLGSKVISGVDVSFDHRYNSIIKNKGQPVPGDPGSQHLNMNATLWFNNNKIYVHFGGDYNYLDNGSSSTLRSNYFSQGNVDVGYVVTQDKSLKIKLSFKTEFNEWLGIWENKGGIGVSYGKEFGKIIKEK